VNGGVTTRHTTRGFKSPGFTIGIQLAVLIILNLLGGVEAYKTIRTGNECMECLRDTDKYRSVCRSKFSEQVSYCCDGNDINSQEACKDSPLCSWLVPDERMWQLACPIEDF
jgi:hypothetical protein